MTPAFEDANSKLVEVFTVVDVDDEKHVDYADCDKAKFLIRL